MANNDQQKITQKTKDRATRTPLIYVLNNCEDVNTSIWNGLNYLVLKPFGIKSMDKHLKCWNDSPPGLNHTIDMSYQFIYIRRVILFYFPLKLTFIKILDCLRLRVEFFLEPHIIRLSTFLSFSFLFYNVWQSLHISDGIYSIELLIMDLAKCIGT